jgi:hypothetical protein
MLPYTAKFYANGTIFDSVGQSNEHYIATYRENDTVYYLRSAAQVDGYNIYNEQISTQVATTRSGESNVKSLVVKQGVAHAFQGYTAKPFDDTSVMYITDDNTLVKDTYDFTSKTTLLSSHSYIRDFFIDEQQNYYVIHNKSSLTKFNKDRIVDYTMKISASASYFVNVVPLTADPELMTVDKVREYTNTGLKQYPIVLGRINTGQMFLARVDDNTSLLSNVTMLPLSGTFYPHNDTRHVNYNLTNYTHLHQKYKNRSLELLFKLTLKNIYNNQDVIQVEIPVDTTVFTTGSHHFVFRLNTTMGKVSLFVDGREHKTINIPPVNYTFQDITQESMCVGATYFYNNIPLFVKLRQPNYYMINNCNIKQFRIYDKAITDDEIRLLTYNNTKMGDLMLSLPCGQRNEIDQIERIFSFNVPGNRSNYINVIVKDTNINNAQLQQRVSEVLTEKLKKVLPVATKINSIKFKSTKQTFNNRIG